MLRLSKTVALQMEFEQFGLNFEAYLPMSQVDGEQSPTPKGTHITKQNLNRIESSLERFKIIMKGTLTQSMINNQKALFVPPVHKNKKVTLAICCTCNCSY